MSDVSDKFLESLTKKSLSNNQAKFEIKKILAKKYKFSMEHGPDKKQLKELSEPFFEKYLELKEQSKSAKTFGLPCWYNLKTARCLKSATRNAEKLYHSFDNNPHMQQKMIDLSRSDCIWNAGTERCRMTPKAGQRNYPRPKGVTKMKVDKKGLLAIELLNTYAAEYGNKNQIMRNAWILCPLRNDEGIHFNQIYKTMGAFVRSKDFETEDMDELKKCLKDAGNVPIEVQDKNQTMKNYLGLKRDKPNYYADYVAANGRSRTKQKRKPKAGDMPPPLEIVRH